MRKIKIQRKKNMFGCGYRHDGDNIENEKK